MLYDVGLLDITSVLKSLEKKQPMKLISQAFLLYVNLVYNFACLCWCSINDVDLVHLFSFFVVCIH